MIMNHLGLLAENVLKPIHIQCYLAETSSWKLRDGVLGYGSDNALELSVWILIAFSMSGIINVISPRCSLIWIQKH